MMQPCLEPDNAGRWVTAAGDDATFRSLVGLKHCLIIGEFDRLCDLLAGRDPVFASDRERFLTLPASVQRQVLLHPASVFWIRSTHKDLLRSGETKASLGNTSSEGERRPGRAAEQFRELLVGAVILAGGEIETILQLDHSGGLSFPGTGLAMRMQGYSAALVAVRISENRGSLTLFAGEEQIPLGAAAGEKCLHLPQVRFNGATVEINNRDRRFVEDWIPNVIYGGSRAEPVEDGSLLRWADRLSRALECLAALDAAIAEEATRLLHCLVPVVSPSRELQVSCSADSFFGACQVSAQGYFELAEEFAHEYRHNILNAIISFEPVFTEDRPGKPSVYSPWKGSPRPLLGILHATYSFQEVLALYTAWLEKHPEDEKRQEQASIQSARLEYVLPRFRAHARLTPFGAAFLERIEARVSLSIEKTAKRSPRLFDLARAQVAKLDQG